MHDLDERIRTTLIGLLLISEGKTSALGRDATHGGERDYTPRSDESWHHYHRRKIMRAHSYGRRKEALEHAEEALKIARGGEARLRKSLPWEEFIVRRYPGWTVADVADAENCHRQQVYRAREKHKVNPSTGLPLAA